MMIIRVLGIEVGIGNTIEEGSILVVNTDQDGNSTIEREDWPTDHHRASWREYDKACDEAKAAGKLGTTEKERVTYAAYRTDVNQRAGRK